MTGICDSPVAAVADIASGSRIAVGGFGICGIPDASTSIVWCTPGGRRPQHRRADSRRIVSAASSLRVTSVTLGAGNRAPR